MDDEVHTHTLEDLEDDQQWGRRLEEKYSPQCEDIVMDSFAVLDVKEARLSSVPNNVDHVNSPAHKR
jgi:hypothetical protein